MDDLAVLYLVQSRRRVDEPQREVNTALVQWFVCRDRASIISFQSGTKF